MGNNKGRSKGCKTCLQRRVKCDQSRPDCKRCITANFTCLGYRESFVDGREQVLRRITRKATGQSKTFSSLTSTLPEPGQDLLLIGNKPNLVQHVPYYYQELSVSPSLSLSAWKTDLFLSHLTASITGPMETVCGELAMQSYHPDSLQRVATKECFLALATTFFGVSHAQPSLVNDGRHLYGRALSTVSTIIKDSSSSVTEILSAVFALCLHEAIEPTRNDEHSWLNHIFGLEQLFEIQGPASTKKDPVYNALLELTRLVMIVAALYARRPSLMAQPEWSILGQSKLNNDIVPATEISFILDALAQIPTLYHERDILAADRNENPTSATNSEDQAYGSRVRILLDRSLHLLNDVRCKRNQWRSSHPGDEFSTLPHINFPSSQPYPCTVVTHFSSLSAANASTFYATIVILLNQFNISMEHLLPLTELNMLAASEEISFAVMEILRSIDYYLQLTSAKPTGIAAIGASPSNFYLLPVRVAYRVLSSSVLEEDVSRKLWLEDVSLVIEGRAGPWASNKQLFRIGKS